jgi:hypothetical protein
MESKEVGADELIVPGQQVAGNNLTDCNKTRKLKMFQTCCLTTILICSKAAGLKTLLSAKAHQLQEIWVFLMIQF